MTAPAPEAPGPSSAARICERAVLGLSAGAAAGVVFVIVQVLAEERQDRGALELALATHAHPPECPAPAAPAGW